jgi:hypothetical protein
MGCQPSDMLQCTIWPSRKLAGDNEVLDGSQPVGLEAKRARILETINVDYDLEMSIYYGHLDLGALLLEADFDISDIAVDDPVPSFELSFQSSDSEKS